jgi:hypothetical protein
MNPKQLNKLTMYLAVKDICDADSSAWQSLRTFAGAYADLKIRVGNIQCQSQDDSDIAESKQAARTAMCSLALPIANLIHIYAVKTKNDQIAMQMNFSMSDLMAGNAREGVTRCQNIHDLANVNLTTLANYGLSAAKLTLLTGAINAYNMLISAPHAAGVAGKTVTDDI